MTQSLAQRRAKHALAAIQGMQSSDYGKYVSYVKALPADIIISGLGQAMAMLNAGKKPGHGLLYGHMQAWLCGGWPHGCYAGKLIPAIVGGNEEDYIRAQAEAMQYLEWLKKFAVAFLTEDDDTGYGTVSGKGSGGDDESSTA